MGKASIIKLLATIVLLLLSFSVVTVLTPYGAATSHDSLYYLDIAANLHNGEGGVTTDFSFGNQGRHLFKEQRAWPPLYPFVLSIVVNDYADVLAAANVSMILLFICLLLVYKIISSQIEWYVALILSCFLAITIPIMTIYTYVWSETLFMSLLVLAIWLSIKYIELDVVATGRKIFFLSILVLTLILLVYTRYVGIVFIVLLPAVYFMSKRNKSDLMFFGAAAGIYALMIGYLLADNFLATGSLSGAVRLPANTSLAENIRDMFSAVKVVFPSSLFHILLALLGATVIVAITWRFPRKGTRTVNANLPATVIVLMLITTLYVSALVLLRTYSHFDRIDVRLLSPAFPAFFMLLIVFPLFFEFRSKTGTVCRFLASFLIIALSVHGYGQLLTSLASLGRDNGPILPSDQRTIYSNFTRNPQANGIKSQYRAMVTGEGVLVVNKPLIYRFATGLNSVQKPNNIDWETFLEINKLPVGSMLILKKNEADQFSLLVKEHNIAPMVVDLGRNIGFKIPMDVLAL